MKFALNFRELSNFNQIRKAKPYLSSRSFYVTNKRRNYKGLLGILVLVRSRWESNLRILGVRAPSCKMSSSSNPLHTKEREKRKTKISIFWTANNCHCVIVNKWMNVYDQCVLRYIQIVYDEILSMMRIKWEQLTRTRLTIYKQRYCYSITNWFSIFTHTHTQDFNI